jgi:single-strand DNA-binding protein
MSQATTIVMRGFIGTDPRTFQTQNSHQGAGGNGCSFRLGSPHGFFDRRHREWRDMPTTWMSVRCFDTLASNATGSLHKGDPVIVAGHLITDEWTVGDQPRSEVVLQADAIGHDLNNGISRFTRVHHAPAPLHDDLARESDSQVHGDSRRSDGNESDANESDARDSDPRDREERHGQESRTNFGVGEAGDDDEDVPDEQEGQDGQNGQ